MAAAVLSLPPAAPAVCPTGWTPSPASATCFLVTPERSTSLFRCVDLCKEHGGTPACIGSAEENDFVTAKLAAADGLWLGLYQNETGLGPAKGWGRCVAGDAPNFANWYEGQPDDNNGYQQDCAFLAASDLFLVAGSGNGQWYDVACDGKGKSFAYSFPCLCARGNASAAFANDLEALEATRSYNQRLVRRRTPIAFTTAIAIALLPTLLLLGRASWRRLRRGADAVLSMHRAQWSAIVTIFGLRSIVGTQGAATSSSRSATAAAFMKTSGAASSAAVKGVLRAARESAAGRRLRVSFAMGQAGWAILAISLAPAVMSLACQSIEAAVGTFFWWLVPYPLGVYLLLLALFPTDARAIRVVCSTVLVLCTVIGMLSIKCTLAGVLNRDWSDAYGFSVATLQFASAGALTPTLRCRGHRAMQPRPALRRLWMVYRLLYLGLGVLLAGCNIADYVQGGGNHVDDLATAASSVVSLLCAALATPRNRGRIHRRLGRLGGRGTEAEEAAAVAALVGGSGPDAALDRASKLLRCLPTSRLHAADLADNMTTAPPAGPTLHERTEPAAMGEVTAFLSHSWNDEKEAPGAKHAVVSRWAERREEETGKEPTLWLDKACIDQGNIQQSLACLPVFLAGCQTLLVVAGPTYCSRLWCVMELFTFARMGGDQKRVEIYLIAHPDDDQTEARRLLTEQFATFDAGKARCSLASDREHLLAVIEAGFGDFHDFNRVARNLLASRVHDELSSRSASP